MSTVDVSRTSAVFSFDDVLPLHEACDSFRTADHSALPSPAMRTYAQKMLAEAEKLATLWVDAVHSITDQLVEIGQLRAQLARDRLDLRRCRQQLSERYCEDCHHADDVGLAQVVREVHDTQHDEPWPVCSNRACRHAQWSD